MMLAFHLYLFVYILLVRKWGHDKSNDSQVEMNLLLFLTTFSSQHIYIHSPLHHVNTPIYTSQLWMLEVEEKKGKASMVSPFYSLLEVGSEIRPCQTFAYPWYSISEKPHYQPQTTRNQTKATPSHYASEMQEESEEARTLRLTIKNPPYDHPHAGDDERDADLRCSSQAIQLLASIRHTLPLGYRYNREGNLVFYRAHEIY